MPEVIDLISSTPPPQAHKQPQKPTLETPFSSSFAATPHLFSSDSLFAFDEPEKPSKRRRVSEEPEPEANLDIHHESKSTINDPFQFSGEEEEDLLPPVSGQQASNVKSPAWDPLAEESDPIVFTSSAPEPVRGKRRERSPLRKTTSQTDTIVIDGDDDLDLDLEPDPGPRRGGGRGRGRGGDDIEEFSSEFAMPDVNDLLDLAEPIEQTANSSFSSRTANLLANLGSLSKGTSAGDGTGGTGPKSARRTRKNQDEDMDSDDGLDSQPRKPVKKTGKATTAEKEAKAREREAAKARREQEKQMENERKQKAKEEKAREKQLAADMSEANKLKVDKKNSTPEMIIDVASSLEGSSACNQTVEFMKRLGVESTFFDSSVPNIVKWRRKVTATFNETAGHWEPCSLHIAPEEHVLCLLASQDFVDMVISPDETENLDRHVRKIKSTYPGCKPIYLIEGLAAWMRKNKNSRNRAYQAEVLRQMEPQGESNTSGRQGRKKSKKPEDTPPVDDDTIEDALLELQVSHACLIHHTNAAPESAEWIKDFTEHVSTIPYRRERMEGNDSAFCMDIGQVKSGVDKADTFVKMLQEVNRVTASMAYGIVHQYPSASDLVGGMRAHGPSMLEDVRVSSHHCLGLYPG